MMKLKKIVGLVAGVMLMFSLAGCGGLSNENKSATGGQNIAISIGHGGAESNLQQIGCLAQKSLLKNNQKDGLRLIFTLIIRWEMMMNWFRWFRTAIFRCA